MRLGVSVGQRGFIPNVTGLEVGADQGALAWRPPWRRADPPFEFVVLLVFHSSVLEPDFDLPLGEGQELGHLDPAWSAEVAVEVKLLLQFHQLGVGVGCAGSLGSWTGRAGFCAGFTCSGNGRFRV